MPTNNPRIAVTLPPSLDLLIGRLALHGRSSKSSVVRELLEAAEPALSRTVALMEAAHKAAAGLRGNLAQQLEAAQSDAERQLGGLLSQLDEATADLVRRAETINERRPAGVTRVAAARLSAATKAGDPPASNRGVKSPPSRAQRGKAGALKRSRRSG